MVPWTWQENKVQNYIGTVFGDESQAYSALGLEGATKTYIRTQIANTTNGCYAGTSLPDVVKKHVYDEAWRSANMKKTDDDELVAFEPEEMQAFTNQYIAFVNRIQYTSASYFLYQWQYFGEKYYDGKRQ